MRKITEGFKESTKAAHEISKKNFAAEKAAAKERHEAYTEPHPGMAEFKEAKGLKAKAKAVIKSMGEDCQRAKEAESGFRDDAIHLRATKELLESERKNRESMIKSL